MQRVSTLLVLTRPLSNIKNIVFFAFLLLAFGRTLSFGEMGALFLALSFVSSAVYAYNAACDRFVDLQNDEKSQRAHAVGAWGVGRVHALAAGLFLVGVLLSFALTWKAGVSNMLLGGVGYLYSSPRFRFKEKPVVDILFGAILPHGLRFLVSWWGLVAGMPPLLAIIFFSSAKAGGYILYKEVDRKVLTRLGLCTTITLLPRKKTFALAAASFLIAFAALVLLTVSGPREPWGFALLSPVVLFFLPVTVIPLVVLFARAAGMIHWKSSVLRVGGLISLLVFLSFLYFFTMH